MLSDRIRHPVGYIDISLVDLKKGMLQPGWPENVAEMMTSITASIKAGEFDYAGNALENLIGHKPLDLKDFL